MDSSLNDSLEQLQKALSDLVGKVQDGKVDDFIKKRATTLLAGPTEDQISDKFYKDVLVANALENDRVAHLAGTDEEGDNQSTLVMDKLRAVQYNQNKQDAAITSMQNMMEELYTIVKALKSNRSEVA